MDEDYKKALEEHENNKGNGGDEPAERLESKAQLGHVQTPEMKHARDQEKYREEASKIGFRPLNLDLLPSKGSFYPKTAKINFRAASKEEITHYSSLDESDLLDVDEHLHSIISATTQISGMTEQGIGHWKDLSEFDKIYIIFTIRDLTMEKMQREHKLMQTIECSSCGHKDKIELENNTFGYYTMDEKIAKYYNPERRCIFISHQRLSRPFSIYIPTMGVMTFIANYIKQKELQKRSGDSVFYDKQFLTFLQFLCPNWRLLDEKYMKQKYEEYKTWNDHDLEMMHNVVNMLGYSIDPNIETPCSKCNHLNKSVIRFQNGYRSIFTFSSIAEELFGD